MKTKKLLLGLIIIFTLWGIHIVNKNINNQIAFYNLWDETESIDLIEEIEEIEIINKIEPEAPKMDQIESLIFDIYYYCPCEICTGKPIQSPSRGLTASGKMAKENHTIAMDSRFPFGTLIKINDKIYQVEDRGGNITNNKIDIFVNDHIYALQKGHRIEKVEIIRWGWED